jgi:hypothetical protein
MAQRSYSHERSGAPSVCGSRVFPIRQQQQLSGVCDALKNLNADQADAGAVKTEARRQHRYYFGGHSVSDRTDFGDRAQSARADPGFVETLFLD